MEVYGAYRANVALIRDAIAENKFQMGHVDQSLVTFQAGLLGVEREMLPIYKLTEKLRETQKNIDLCVHELRRINENFVAAQELAPTLMNGAKFDQDEYVGALQKLLLAITFLESHRAYEGSARALDQARDLLVQARKKCKADFLSAAAVLSRGSRRDDADRRLAWSKPNREDVARAAQLLTCLLSSHADVAELLADYGKQRFQVVRMFLSDESAGASSSGVQFSVAEPMDELSRRLADIETTIQAEKALAEAVFATEELSHAAFRHATHPILDAWRKEIDASLQAPPGGAKQQQQAAATAVDPFKLLQLHELLSLRLKDLDALVQPPLLLRDRQGRALDDPWVLTKSLGAVLSEVALATKQKLFGFQFELTEQIGVGDRALAKDGNVHPVSSHMLNFVRHVCDHTKPLRVLLTRESNVSPPVFVETVVMQLVEALQAKCAQFKGRGDLKQLFLANNFGYISHSLPPCDDKEIAAHIQSEIRPRLEELRDKAIAAFIQTSYQPFATFLCDPKEKLVYAKGGSLLTLESGRLLKEKFARFNELIEDVHDTQQHFIVSEPPIRHRLIEAAVDAIVPRYAAFYEKYSVIQFSKKNSSKYLKYTPKAVELLLKELFLGEVIKHDK